MPFDTILNELEHLVDYFLFQPIIVTIIILLFLLGFVFLRRVFTCCQCLLKLPFFTSHLNRNNLVFDNGSKTLEDGFRFLVRKEELVNCVLDSLVASFE